MPDANQATSDWFWEGNVVETLASHLVETGWQISSMADTHSKERGADIIANKGDAVLIVEAKGYPSTKYRDPNRAHEKKKAAPTNQAQHWFSHAILKAIRLQNQHPEAAIAVAFPDFPRYRNLFGETEHAFARLGIGFILTQEDGQIRSFGLELK